MFKIIKKNQASTQVIEIEKIQTALKQVLSKDSVSQFQDIVHRNHLFSSSQKLAQELKSQYSQFVIVGIGGSSMGARALCELSGTQNILFLDNVDSNELQTTWNKIKTNPNKTAFLFISKSGSTVEILWNITTLENLFSQEYKKSLWSQSYFVSELTNNPLAQMAREHQRPLLEVPLDIGGRFSVLTPVGLIIAELCGFNTDDIRTGAKNAIEQNELVTSQVATYLESFKRHETISLFWFYNSNMRWFGGWLQQLWAESLGKKETRDHKPCPVNSTPMIAVGSSDQHSILQQVAHGPHDKFVTFFTFNTVETSPIKNTKVVFKEINYLNEKNYGELIKHQALATYEALQMNGVSAQLIAVDDHSISQTLGYMFMFYQLVVATIGVYQNINPFDQPGVTLGKDLTVKFLKG